MSGPEGHIDGRLIYDRDLFEVATARRIAGHWLHLAATVAADPGAAISGIPMLTADEEQRQLVEWNATATSAGAATVQDLRGVQLAKARADAAVAAGQTASRIGRPRPPGRRRRRSPAGRGACSTATSSASARSPRSTWSPERSGCSRAVPHTCCSIPDVGVERLESMVVDCGAMAVLAAGWGRRAGGLPADAGARASRWRAMHHPTAAALPDVAPDAVCCVAYAESPVGAGVAGSRCATPPSSISPRHWAADLGLGPADTVLILPATVFDAPVFELWTALLAGARVFYRASRRGR